MQASKDLIVSGSPTEEVLNCSVSNVTYRFTHLLHLKPVKTKCGDKTYNARARVGVLLENMIEKQHVL